MAYAPPTEQLPPSHAPLQQSAEVAQVSPEMEQHEVSCPWAGAGQVCPLGQGPVRTPSQEHWPAGAGLPWQTESSMHVPVNGQQ